MLTNSWEKEQHIQSPEVELCPGINHSPILPGTFSDQGWKGRREEEPAPCKGLGMSKGLAHPGYE